MSTDINFENTNEDQLHQMAYTFTMQYKKKMVALYDAEEYSYTCVEPYIYKLEFPNNKNNDKITIWVKKEIWFEFLEIDDIIENINKQFRKLADERIAKKAVIEEVDYEWASVKKVEQ